MTLYFIRHGETAWSVSGQHTGRTDLPLTQRGEQMARKLMPHMQETPFCLVLSSPRLRARQTCELAGLGADAETDPNLAEWNYGDYEGLRLDEILSINPFWDIWSDGCPGGENPAEISDRADQVIARLKDLHGNVALFSHGNFGRVLAAIWIGMPISLGQCLVLNPASISILGFQLGLRPNRVICRWNAT